MLPVFPAHKIIALSDYEVIERFTKQFPPYNDFEFTSLWTYNTKKENTISILNDNLIIKIQDFITGEFFYSFLGINKTKETIKALFSKCKEEHMDISLKLVPEVNLQNTPHLDKYFSIKEDTDSFDYILSVDELADLKGNKYYDKRNLVNRFKKNYPQHSIMPLDLTDKKTQNEMKELFFLWAKLKGGNNEETKIEYIALEKLYDLISMLHIIGTGIYIQDKLIGFSTYHIVQDNYAIMSFEKGDLTYNGIYATLNHESAKRLKELGTKYINYEQDLGIPGLKKAKMLWRPVFFLKKYTIEELR